MTRAATPQTDVSRTGTPVPQLRGKAALAAHDKQSELREPENRSTMAQPRRSYSKT